MNIQILYGHVRKEYINRTQINNYPKLSRLIWLGNYEWFANIIVLTSSILNSTRTEQSRLFDSFPPTCCLIIQRFRRITKLRRASDKLRLQPYTQIFQKIRRRNLLPEMKCISDSSGINRTLILIQRTVLLTGWPSRRRVICPCSFLLVSPACGFATPSYQTLHFHTVCP